MYGFVVYEYLRLLVAIIYCSDLAHARPAIRPSLAMNAMEIWRKLMAKGFFALTANLNTSQDNELRERRDLGARAITLQQKGLALALANVYGEQLVVDGVAGFLQLGLLLGLFSFIGTLANMTATPIMSVLAPAFWPRRPSQVRSPSSIWLAVRLLARRASTMTCLYVAKSAAVQ